MRLALLTAGTLTLAAVWLGPLPQLARRAFFAHMAMHMGIVAVAAPLLALAVAGSRFDPVRKAPGLFPPIPMSVLELFAVGVWHAPALHDAARSSLSGFAAEQGTFLAAGILVWLSAFGGGPIRPRSRTAAGVVAILLTSMHMTLLGALLALAPRPLYHGGEGPVGLGDSAVALALCRFPGFDVENAAGLTPLDDQHLGGAIMLFVGGVSYLLGGLWLTAALLRNEGFVTGEGR